MSLADTPAVNLADTPATWQDPPPMSTLHALLVYVGAPVLIIAVITLLVMAPSLAKGPRYRPSQQWSAEAEWFGAPSGQVEGDKSPALESGPCGSRRDGGTKPSDDSGGASATW